MNEIDSIPLECPKCGKVGWVSINRLDKQLKCKACGTKFYVNSTGGGVSIGVRPKVFKDPFKMEMPDRRKPDFAERAFRRLGGISPRTWRNVKIGAAVPVALALVFVLLKPFLFPPPPIPALLPSRAEAVVKALAKKDMAMLYALTSPSTQGDLAKWAELALPKGFPEAPPILPITGNNTLFQNVKKGKACVEVMVCFAPPPPVPAPEPEPEPAETEAAPATEPSPPGEAPAAESPQSPDMKAEAPAEEGKDQAPATEAEAEAERPPEPPAPKAPPAPVYRFRLYWVTDAGTSWKFDATETLKSLKK